MTSTESRSLAAITYPHSTVQRAKRALQCSPFRPKLLADMRSHGITLRSIAENRGVYNGYTQYPISELAAESALMWLIAVGLLRREVDGQGLTDSFRLTPLGRQLFQAIEAAGSPDFHPGPLDHIYNSLSRWLQLPSWLQ